jgi:hypothetical protein
VGDDVLSAHTPLPATFSLGASLGVYSRQHAVSFKACLFLFEEGNGEFIDAFDNCCMKLGLPQAFYEPLRRHAGLNDEFDHGDISRLLLQELPIVDPETSAIVKQNVSVLIETLVQQEEQIMAHYGASNEGAQETEDQPLAVRTPGRRRQPRFDRAAGAEQGADADPDDADQRPQARQNDEHLCPDRDEERSGG